METLKKFIKFDPKKDNPNIIPNSIGNYLIVLKANSVLPNIGIECIYSEFDKKKVIYTGVSNKSLRSRDFKQHFNGNAGNSTFRKSLGSMFGYKKIPRDKVENGKTKFNELDENKISNWMLENLEMYFYSNINTNTLEDEIISELNPPLNLSKNKNTENIEFRQKITFLRSIK